ncbi:MAG: glycine cleavage system aminomethyltransferase GcvT [Pirellulales bacterium]
MTDRLLETPLAEWHRAHGAKMVDFGGWSMPVQYTSIVTEHLATRSGTGLFDVSHMGRFRLLGPGAAGFLDRVVTRRVSDLRPGRIRYALVTDASGGTLDDVLVYHLRDLAGQSYYWLVVNAGNRQRIWDWLQGLNPLSDGVQLEDLTLQTGMIAVQGPTAVARSSGLLGTDISRWPYYSAQELQWHGVTIMVSRTGYTGEDGCEWTVPSELTETAWQTLLDAAPVPGVPIGLGARDTLRMEAAMPLYGHELTEEIDPFSAGLDFAVDLEQREFPGHDALVRIRQSGAPWIRVGLILDGKRIARQGYPIYIGERRVGEVTSGTLSPTLDQAIAMGYVQRSSWPAGEPISVDVRGRRIEAQPAPLPFYQRPR